MNKVLLVENQQGVHILDASDISNLHYCNDPKKITVELKNGKQWHKVGTGGFLRVEIIDIKNEHLDFLGANLFVRKTKDLVSNEPKSKKGRPKKNENLESDPVNEMNPFADVNV